MRIGSSLLSAPKAHLGAVLVVFSFLLPLRALAQEETDAQTAAAATSGDAGGFGESWRSKSRRAGKRQAEAPADTGADTGDIAEIEMFVGETRVFPAPAVARVAVGNGSLMSAASLDEKEVIVFANAPGTSSLFIWNRNGKYRRLKINIVPGDTSRLAREIAAFLASIPNAKASVIGDKVIVEGDDLSDQDLAKIVELAKRYPQIVNFTNPVGWDQMVLLDVKVVEFPKNELREIGLKWNPTGGAAVAGIGMPGSRGKPGEYQITQQTGDGNGLPISGQGGPSASTPLYQSLTILSAVNMGLNAQLSLLAQDGKASILAEPQLSARNGSDANFLAGGEYPYAVTTLLGTTVFFKPYGIKLRIRPLISKNGTIRAKIESEVSAIDASVSTTGGPALSSRKTETEFNVRNGETMVLAGLLTRKNSISVDKVPFLGDLPVLGALFRSQRFQNDETELVVFVTPTIVDSRAPGLVERVERTGQKLEKDLGRTPYLSNAIQPGRDPAQPMLPPLPEPVVETENADTPPSTQPTLPEFLQGLPQPTQQASPPEPQPVAEATTTAVFQEGNNLVRRAQSIREATGVANPGSPAEALEGTTGSSTGAEPALPKSAKYRVTGNRLALRAGPSSNEPIVAWLSLGSKVEGMSMSADGVWMAVGWAEKQSGWGEVRYLTPIAPEVR